MSIEPLNPHADLERGRHSSPSTTSQPFQYKFPNRLSGREAPFLHSKHRMPLGV